MFFKKLLGMDDSDEESKKQADNKTPRQSQKDSQKSSKPQPAAAVLKKSKTQRASGKKSSGKKKPNSKEAAKDIEQLQPPALVRAQTTKMNNEPNSPVATDSVCCDDDFQESSHPNVLPTQGSLAQLGVNISTLNQHTQNQQYVEQHYVRQTWDVNRFNHLPVGQNQTQNWMGEINEVAEDFPSDAGEIGIINQSIIRNPNLDLSGIDHTPGGGFNTTFFGAPESTQKLMHQYWTAFMSFYQLFLEDIDFFNASPEMKQSIIQASNPDDISPDILNLRQELFKYNNELTRVPAINQNLLAMIQLLKEENKREKNRHNTSNVAHSMGEAMEFMIENGVVEIMVSYAIIDQPQGFFKFLLGALQDMLNSVQSQSCLLSHASVNQSIRYLLLTIFNKLEEIPFQDGDDQTPRKPDPRYISKQRPSVVYYTSDILGFIKSILSQVSNQVSLIRLLFCKEDAGLLNRRQEDKEAIRQYQMNTDPEMGVIGISYGGGASPIQQNVGNASAVHVSYDVCLPFHILSFYIKNQKSMLTEVEKDLLESIIVLAFNSLCVDAKFVYYLINESDFIEILMSIISNSLEILPNTLDPLDQAGSFNLMRQLDHQSSFFVKEQYSEFRDGCKLLNLVFSALEIKSKDIFTKKRNKDDMQAQMQGIAQIEKAFLQGFVQIILVQTYQPRLLSLKTEYDQAESFSLANDGMSEFRTWVQYLIEVVKEIEAKPFAMVTQAFISDSLSQNFDKYLSLILQEALAELNSKSETVKSKLERFDYKGRRNQVKNLNVIEEIIQDDEENSFGGRPNDHDDLKGTIENLYPQRQTTSRFSIHNPRARFSLAPDQMRQTIKNFQQISKVQQMNGQKVQAEDILKYNRANLQLNQQSGISNNSLLFQRQGLQTETGGLSSNQLACDSLVNQTDNNIGVNDNIQSLFAMAEALEKQETQPDDYINELQKNQFRQIKFGNAKSKVLREQIHHALFKPQGEISLVTLKLIHTLIQECGHHQFIKDNFRVTQKVSRTKDSSNMYNTKYKQMLELNPQTRHKTLVDHPEVLYHLIDNAENEKQIQLLSKLNTCHDFLSLHLLHRQLLQLYFSEEFMITFSLKNLYWVSSYQQSTYNPQDNEVMLFNDSETDIPLRGRTPGGVSDLPTEVYHQRDKKIMSLHLWDRLLQKLEVFSDNRPNENALLCQVILSLFQTPEPFKKQTLKSKRNATDYSFGEKKIPLELVQWWLYAIQFEERLEPREGAKNAAASEDSDDECIVMSALETSPEPSRHTQGLVSGTGGMSDEDFSGGPNSKSQKSKEKLSTIKEEKRKSLNKNLFSVLATVKKQMDQVNKSDKVQAFKSALMEQHVQETTKSKKKFSKNASMASESKINNNIENPEVHNPPLSSAEKNKAKLRERLDSEQKQPHIFKDGTLILAENALIFEDFYTKLWEELTIISLSISMVINCGAMAQDSISEKEFCQEGRIICQNIDQRSLLVSKASLDTSVAAMEGYLSKIDDL